MNLMARQTMCVGPSMSIRQAAALRKMISRQRAIITLMVKMASGVTQSNRTAHITSTVHVSMPQSNSYNYNHGHHRIINLLPTDNMFMFSRHKTDVVLDQGSLE